MQSWGKGLLLRMLGPLSILRLWAQETVGESFQLYHLEKVGLTVMKICVSGLFPGCVLLYKQDFTKKLGLCCITCTYCSQTCQRGVTEQLDGSTWDFCSEDCKSKYLLWYCKVRGSRTGGDGNRLLCCDQVWANLQGGGSS